MKYMLKIFPKQLHVNKIIVIISIFFFCSLVLGIFLNTTALLLLIGVTIFSYLKEKSKARLKNGLFWLVLFFVFWNILIIVMNNTVIKESLNETITFSPLLLIVTCFSLNRRRLTHNFFYKLELAFIFACMVSVSLNLILGIYRGIYLPPRINYYFLSYENLGVVFGIQAYYLSLFYLISCLFVIKNLNKIKYSLFYLIILLINIFFLSSRMTIFMALIIPLYTFLKFENRKYLAKITIIGFTLFISVFIFNPILNERINTINLKTTNYSGIELRKKIWKNAFEVIKKSPFFGYGMQNTEQKLIEQYTRKRFRVALRNNYHSHNQFLQTTLESGLIGLFLLIAIIISSTYRLYKNGQIAYLLAFYAIIGSMFTESIFKRQWGLFLFAFFVGISLIKPMNEEYDNKINLK